MNKKPMNTNEIFRRYWSALCAITDDGHGLDDGAVRLALHLAINDTSALSLAFDQNLQRMYEADAAQIVRMNDWLAEHAPDFYRMPGDTATAVIAALEAKDEHIRMLIQNSPLVAAQNEAAMLRQQLALEQAEVAHLVGEIETLRNIQTTGD